MSESLSFTVAAYSFGLAGWSLARSVLGRPVTGGQAGAALVLGLGSALQAALAAIGVAGGHDVREPVVLCAYLVASVAVLPLVWPNVSSDDGPWGGVTLAIACAALGVMSLRALDVWQP